MEELRRIFGMDGKHPDTGEYLNDAYFYTCTNKTDLDVCTDLQIACFTMGTDQSKTVMTHEVVTHVDYTRIS
jgi:hypothetical protein